MRTGGARIGVNRPSKFPDASFVMADAVSPPGRPRRGWWGQSESPGRAEPRSRGGRRSSRPRPERKRRRGGESGAAGRAGTPSRHHGAPASSPEAQPHGRGFGRAPNPRRLGRRSFPARGLAEARAARPSPPVRARWGPATAPTHTAECTTPTGPMAARSSRPTRPPPAGRSPPALCDRVWGAHARPRPRPPGGRLRIARRADRWRR